MCECTALILRCFAVDQEHLHKLGLVVSNGQRLQMFVNDLTAPQAQRAVGTLNAAKWGLNNLMLSVVHMFGIHPARMKPVGFIAAYDSAKATLAARPNMALKTPQ